MNLHLFLTKRSERLRASFTLIPKEKSSATLIAG
jgi:hypothetical protein